MVMDPLTLVTGSSMKTSEAFLNVTVLPWKATGTLTLSMFMSLSETRCESILPPAVMALPLPLTVKAAFTLPLMFAGAEGTILGSMARSKSLTLKATSAATSLPPALTVPLSVAGLPAILEPPETVTSPLLSNAALKSVAVTLAPPSVSLSALTWALPLRAFTGPSTATLTASTCPLSSAGSEGRFLRRVSAVTGPSVFMFTLMEGVLPPRSANTSPLVGMPMALTARGLRLTFMSFIATVALAETGKPMAEPSSKLTVPAAAGLSNAPVTVMSAVTRPLTRKLFSWGTRADRSPTCTLLTAAFRFNSGVTPPLTLIVPPAVWMSPLLIVRLGAMLTLKLPFMGRPLRAMSKAASASLPSSVPPTELS